MADEKDRLGDKLRQKEKGEEDRFFADRDAAALEKLRRAKAAAVESGPLGRCPKDGEALTSVEHHGVTVDECPKCHGMWLTPGEIELIAKRDRDSWIGRYFLRGKS